MRDSQGTKSKTLDVTGMTDLEEKVDDVKVYGNPGAWQLLCKASSEAQDWMKSTKAMEVPGLGVLVQVSTQQGNRVAEALCMVAGATIVKDPKTGLLVLAQSALIERFSASVNDLLDTQADKKEQAGKKKPRKSAPKPRSRK